MLQITSGLLKGLKVKSPDSKETRPTGEKMRQGLFNILRNYRWKDAQNIIDGALIADIFAGTGAFGIESLSNGAKEVVFVENGRHVLPCLKSNLDLALTHLEKQGFVDRKASLMTVDIVRAYSKLPKTRLIFCDPPYFKDWFIKITDLEAEFDRIEPHGVFIFESDKREVIESGYAVKSGLKLFDQKDYGGSRVFFFVKSCIEN